MLRVTRQWSRLSPKANGMRLSGNGTESLRQSAHRIQLRTVGNSMSTPEWQIAFPTGNLVATYRGIRIVIKLAETRNPFEIGWFINGQEVESVPVSCDREWAKKLAVDFIDERIPVDEEWKQAEKKDQESDLS